MLKTVLITVENFMIENKQIYLEADVNQLYIQFGRTTKKVNIKLYNSYQHDFAHLLNLKTN